VSRRNYEELTATGKIEFGDISLDEIKTAVSQLP
jgi:hypothetical protein